MVQNPLQNLLSRGRVRQICKVLVLLVFTASLILSCDQQEGRDSSTGTQLAKKTSQPTSTGTEPATRIQETGTNLPTKESPKNEDQAQTDQPAEFEPADIVEPQAVVDQVVFALDDPDPEVREDALEALESIDDPAVNAALSKALNDENPDVREAAMDVLAELESPNTLASLEQALSYGDEDMRESALEILEEMSDPKAIDIIIETGLLNDNIDIQEDALDTLESITDQEFESSQQARDWWNQNWNTFQFDE
jgi:hypothetical protein